MARQRPREPSIRRRGPRDACRRWRGGGTRVEPDRPWAAIPAQPRNGAGLRSRRARGWRGARHDCPGRWRAGGRSGRGADRAPGRPRAADRQGRCPRPRPVARHAAAGGHHRVGHHAPGGAGGYPGDGDRGDRRRPSRGGSQLRHLVRHRRAGRHPGGGRVQRRESHARPAGYVRAARDATGAGDRCRDGPCPGLLCRRHPAAGPLSRRQRGRGGGHHRSALRPARQRRHALRPAAARRTRAGRR